MQVWSLGWDNPWRRAWQPTAVFLPGKPHGQRSLAGYSPWSRKESDTTEQLTHTHTRATLLCKIVDEGSVWGPLLTTQKPVNRPGWWKRKFALFQMPATGEGEGGGHLSKGQLSNPDKQGVRVFTELGLGGYTQKQHSHLQQSSSNRSSVV